MSSLTDPSSATGGHEPAKIEPKDNHDQLPKGNVSVKVGGAPDKKKKKSRGGKGGKNRGTGFEGESNCIRPWGCAMLLR